MHIPDRLAPLFEDGTLERVVRPLMSGKEAQVYLVIARGELCVAKVYKEANNRSFKNRAEYTEGRKTRNSRDQRAIEKRSAHGRSQDEAAWRSTEVDMIHRLHAGGVRVPIPKAFVDGVLVMECVVDAEGSPAPRLGEISLPPEAARAVYDGVIREAVRMLAAGVVHGDLSPFNVLVSAEGPVIIDFPQSVNAAGNMNARKLLLRDIDNFHRYLLQSVPGSVRRPYAEEMWELYEQNALTADTRLSGKYVSSRRVSTDESVFDLIKDANYDEQKRRERLGLKGGPSTGPKGAPGGAPRGPRGPAAPQPVYQSKARFGGKAMVLTPRNGPEPTPAQRPHNPQQPSQQARPQQPDRLQHQGRPPQQPDRLQHQGRPPQQPDRPQQQRPQQHQGRSSQQQERSQHQRPQQDQQRPEQHQRPQQHQQRPQPHQQHPQQERPQHQQPQRTQPERPRPQPPERPVATQQQEQPPNGGSAEWRPQRRTVAKSRTTRPVER